jgi:glucose dehydrogenase
MALKDVLIVMEQIGLTDVILPFVLVFTVIFGVLQKSKVLGVYEGNKPKTNLNAMVAFVIAFFVLIMIQTLQVITWLTRYAALLAVAFVFVGLLVAMVGARMHLRTPVMLIALFLIGLALVQSLAWAGVLSDEPTRILILILLGVAIIAFGGWAVLGWGRERPKKDEKPKEKKKPEAEPAEEGEENPPVIQISPAEMQEILKKRAKKK